MKHSIKIQLSLIFSGLMAVTVFFCWFINNTFLETYYMDKKQSTLMTVYHRLNEAFADGSVTTDEFNIELQKLCGKYNISVLVLDENSKALMATMHDPKINKKQLLDNIFLSNSHPELERVLQKTDHYVMRSTLNPQTNTEYIEMLGFLEEGNLFIIGTPREGIMESVEIANRFLIYAGLTAALLGGIVILFVSGKITKPILELAGISEKMIHLDFQTKYEGKKSNEIGMLGENINKLSSALEQTISELKTANNELQKDMERREQLDEMRKEFLSNVSHELKTPIALIQGYAEGLMENIQEDAQSREFYCEVIMDEAARMNDMVKKLLSLNQLESGNDIVTMEHFDVREMVETFLQSVDILVKQKKIHVQVDGASPCYVWGDVYKTEEVIRNYFSNALHHCSGENIIHVKLFKKNDKVRVSVFNTGNPIPGESLPHIWEKFYKVDKARTREYGGSGIGLSIVKAIMESMNEQFGVINYENGVEFWFELAVN